MANWKTAGYYAQSASPVMHLPRSAEIALADAVAGVYRKRSFVGNGKAGRSKAEMAVKGPLPDVNGEQSVERVRSGHSVHNPLDGGGHASPTVGRGSGKRGGKDRGRGGAGRRSVAESTPKKRLGRRS